MQKRNDSTPTWNVNQEGILKIVLERQKRECLFFSLCSSKLKVVNQNMSPQNVPSVFPVRGNAIKQKTRMIQQGRCSNSCVVTLLLTVTEGQDGKYCINLCKPLGLAGRVVQGRCNLFQRPDKALCSGPLSFRKEAVDNTVSHRCPSPCFPNLQSLLLKSLVCVLSDTFYPSPNALCQSQPLNFFLYIMSNVTGMIQYM